MTTRSNERCGACGTGPNLLTQHCECGLMAVFECRRCDRLYFTFADYRNGGVGQPWACGSCGRETGEDVALVKRGVYTAPEPPVGRESSALPLPKRYLCAECNIEFAGVGGREYKCPQCDAPLVELPGDLPLSTAVDIYVRSFPIYRQSALCTRCGKREEDHPVKQEANLMRKHPRIECLTFHAALWGKRPAYA